MIAWKEDIIPLGKMRRPSSKLHKNAAYLTIVIYAFMSLFVQFAHNDDIFIFNSKTSTSASIPAHFSLTQSHDTDCPACEWIASTHGAGVYSQSIDLAPHDRLDRQHSILESIRSVSSLHNFLRGPPTA
jgi:hypothetical protein